MIKEDLLRQLIEIIILRKKKNFNRIKNVIFNTTVIQ